MYDVSFCSQTPNLLPKVWMYNEESLCIHENVIFVLSADRLRLGRR